MRTHKRRTSLDIGTYNFFFCKEEKKSEKWKLDGKMKHKIQKWKNTKINENNEMIEINYKTTSDRVSR